MEHNMEFNLIAMASTGSVVAGFEREITKTTKVIEKAVELKNKEQALNEEYQKATKQLELLNKKYVQ